MSWLRTVGEYLGLVLPWEPQIGDVVVYRSRTGNYSIPAIVNCTYDSIDPRGVELGHVPPLTGPYHVHLTVFTPGKPGTTRGGAAPTSQNVAGCYQEWDIPVGAGPGHYRPSKELR